MDNKRSIIVGLFLFLVASQPAFAIIVSSGHEHRANVNFVPAPRLMAPVPVDGKVDLKGKRSLTFEWSTEGDPVQRDYYDFRIYKGYSMIASTLVFKEKARSYQIQVKSDLFENGQVYSWAVRQVDKASNKSRRNSSTFTALR